MKKAILFLAMVLAQTAAFAEYVTNGDGTTYTFATLADIPEAGIVATPPPYPSLPTEYRLTTSITIAAGDRFELDEYAFVDLDGGVAFTIDGEASFIPLDACLIRADEENTVVRINCSQHVDFEHVSFVKTGVEVRGDGGVTFRNCYFFSHDGSSAAALYFISAGAPSVVEDCMFGDCRKAAIGSAANASQPLTIRNCKVSRNSVANGNIPQINVTAANPLVIESTTVTGIPDNNMVGGIGISNFMRYDADVTIKDCTIEDNRYGIGLVGPAQKIRIEGNTLLNNCHETNPMNGGSGISLYDPYQLTCATITANHIEGSLWGITIIGCKDVNVGCLEEGDRYNPGLNVFRDNGFDGQLYDLYNNSSLTVYAQNNTWNVGEQTEEQIETVVFHKNDDASLGEVIFMPAATTTSVAERLAPSLAEGPSFNLQGQRVDNPTRPGLYIRNGRKVVRR